MSANEFDFLKIETHVLKVHVHCQGCKNKVRKLLRNLEGVYKVSIDAEQQKVMVLGSVDSAALIKKLVRAGKHAELWSPRSNHSQHLEEQANFTNYDKNNMYFLINGPKSPMYPIDYLGSEVNDEWDSQRYLYQNMGMNTGEVDDNFMATKVGWDEDTIVGSSKMEDDMISMMGHAGSVGFGGHEFGASLDFSAGLPAYEYYHPSFMMLNNRQGYHHVYPSTEMMNIYMQDRHRINNIMLNDYM